MMGKVLSPCGSIEAVCAAVANGAHEIYLGGGDHNARQYAKNFSADEIAGVVAFCHENGVKVLVTLNILEGDRELASALAFAKQMRDIGVDALIVQDWGLAYLLREYIPDMELHGSTQMSVHSLDGAKMCKELGMKRVVLARELSSKNIKYITDNCGIETEIFVHGALCYAYSGQCLMSAVIGRRSGNRGRCAGPCRLPYTISGKKGYFLSLKDLCLADKMGEVAKTGASAYKIEGRMKRAEYVGAVTRAYARGDYNKKTLSEIFSRSGFTSSFFDGRKGAFDLGVKVDEDIKKYSALLSKERVRYERLISQIKPVSAPPADEQAAKDFIASKTFAKKKGENKLYCFALNLSQAKVLGGDVVFLPVEEIIKNSLSGYGIHLPKIITDDERSHYAEMLCKAKKLGNTIVCVENIGQVALVKECGLDFICGISLNAFNRFSVQYLYSLGARDVLLSAECSAPQIRDITKACAGGIFAYGRLPLMVSESCIGKNALGCDGRRCRMPQMLSDRAGQKFFVTKAPKCRNVIYNSVPVWLADRESEIKELNLSSRALFFTDESPAKCAEVMLCYKERKGKPSGEFTRGMFAKKVL